VPTIADNDAGGFPKGMAIRFKLPDESHADLVLISINDFPAATPEEFLGLLQAVAASKKEPETIQKFLAEHPAAMRFVSTPKPLPESFATQPFFGVNAFKFTNAKGETKYGRYRVEPVVGARFLNEDASKTAATEYLTKELPARLQKGPYAYKISVQLANPGDEVNDPTALWPADRRVVELGTLTIDNVSADAQVYEKTMFNPLNLVEGIEPSEDKILLARPTAYAVSFGRRLQP
jgi:catalase